MKKIFTLLLLGITLISCSAKSNEEVSDTTFSSDLTTLLKAEDGDFVEPTHFTYSSSCIKDDEYYQYSLTVSYYDEEIDNVRIIVLPYSYNLNSSISKVTNVGYDNEVNLASKTDISSHNFSAIELNYKYTKNDEAMKFLLRNNEKIYIIKVNF